MCEVWGPTLVVAAETMTRVLAQGPRAKETAILFGMAPGGAWWLPVMSPGDSGCSHFDDATFSEALHMEFVSTLEMDGRTIIMHAVRKLARAVTELMERNSLRVEQVGLFLFHQANLRLLERLMKELKIDPSQCFVNIDKYGNTSSASWLIAASEAKASGRLRSAMKVVVAAFGAGLSWGAALMEVV